VGVFFLADPLRLTFSTGPLLDLEEGLVTTEERVETNIEHQAGRLQREAALLGLAVLGACLAAAPTGRRLSLGGPLGLLAVLFLVWCAATLAWSGLPFVTARKLAVLACLAVGALGVARWLSARDVVSLTLFGCGLVLAVGLLCELALGTFRPWRASYRFSGLTWPAFTAWMASLFLLAALARLASAGRYRPALAAAAVAALGLLLLTKTRASVAAFLLAAAIHCCLTWPARRVLAAVLALAVAGSAFGLAAELLTGGRELDALVDAANLGRTESAADISGRGELWAELAAYVRGRPLGGYGYGTFWTPDRLAAVGGDNWGAPDAHNGFLDLTLGVGLVGLGAYALVLLLGLGRAWARYRGTADPAYVFAGGAVIVLVVNTLFVSTHLSPTLYGFIGLVVLAQLAFVEPSPADGGKEGRP
jgi:O-antigen ligase